jgi:hypothetical protein
MFHQALQTPHLRPSPAPNERTTCCARARSAKKPAGVSPYSAAICNS